MPFDDQFITQFQLTPGHMIVDVRSEAEYQDGHIEGAVLIPLPYLIRGYLLETLKNSTLVCVYCAHGVRSWHATLYLRQRGVEVIDLGGVVDYLGPLVMD